jgi:hypothetical protein
MSGTKIAVIGGGVAGSSIALYLSEIGVSVTLFESSDSLVNGPPICHLHAGGNLYREISDEQCLTLLQESVEFMRTYPYAIDFRPTVIAVPKADNGTPQELLPRLLKLQSKYKQLIQQDEKNMVLGSVDEYFKFFTKDDIKLLRDKEILKTPTTMDEWIVPFAKSVDIETIKFPIVIVQEYGINLFRLASTLSISLNKSQNVELKLNTKIKEIQKKSNRWVVDNKEYDYLINAAGFRSGEIDDMVGFKTKRMVEFKAAYVTKCEKFNHTSPEIIFHGQRGTPAGMAQFTPYPDGYFQLHGMTQDITLFKDGLVKSSRYSSQPKLDTRFIKKIEGGWSKECVDTRTKKAIKHISKYIPAFKDAVVTKKPLYGAQQIPGDDETLRAANVSFDKNYARCEIVKASSVLSMSDEITKELIKLNYIDETMYAKRLYRFAKSLDVVDISKLAKKLALERDYPASLANVCFPSTKI